MAVAIGFLSLPTELICFILSLLPPRDLSRCAITCKAVRDAAQNSIHAQYKLELHAQGSTETASLDSIDVDRKMSSLKRLASLWRSDFHTNTVFQDAVSPVSEHSPGIQYMKCGIWWMWENDNLFIRDCNTDIKLSRSFPRHKCLSQDRFPRSVVLDPTQDLVVVVPMPDLCTVTGTEQDYHIFSVEFRLASSLLPHPDSVDASLKCNHSFDASGQYRVALLQDPGICGDRVIALYVVLKLDPPNVMVKSDVFIQVINWRKGHAMGYPLCTNITGFRLLDEQKAVATDTSGVITLYALQEHGPPQRLIMYRLHESVCAPYYLFHATPTFRAMVFPDLMPGYVPSLESQVIVLETLTNARPVILVIDMVIFSGKALPSETPIEIPWSKWGPQYTYCFRHQPNFQISVSGSKIAYALPGDLTHDLAQTLEGVSTERFFYVHIWDFNKRVIARAENIHDPDSPISLIHSPDYLGPLDSIRPYIATVCLTPFSSHCFERLFLEHDRLTLTWLHNYTVHIQVVSPVQTEVGSDPAH